jgi:hypothetical protein
VATCPRPSCNWTGEAATFEEAGTLREEHMTNHHYSPTVEEVVAHVEHVLLPMTVSQISRDLEAVADFYERKAMQLRGHAAAVRIDGATWAPPGFEQLALQYADIIAHNSLGTTSSVAREIATATGHATLLTALHPERHQKPEEES